MIKLTDYKTKKQKEFITKELIDLKDTLRFMIEILIPYKRYRNAKDVLTELKLQVELLEVKINKLNEDI